MPTLRLAIVLVLGAGCSVGEAPRTDAPAGPPTPSAAKSAAPAASTSAAPQPSGCPTEWTCDYAAFEADPKKRPAITEVLIEKQAHRLHLAHDKVIVRSYGVALGAGGMGQKHYEGDWVTPIGTYSVTGRYPSRWHTYLALDYPNDEDKKRHAELSARGEIPEGRGPGSAIAIHGHRADQPDKLHKLVDWTRGCIALDNAEIDEVASVVPIGTRVVIVP